MKSTLIVIKEHIKNFYLVIRLSLFELKSTNNNQYLGMLWEIINPMILIGIYWFVFGYGIRGGKGVDGIDYLPWMLTGIVVWFFISQALIQGSKSIYSRISIISKMNFSMSVIPSYVILSRIYQHFLITIIAMLILLFYGYMPSIYLIQLPYFMIATILVLVAISLITSTLSTIIRDVHNILQSVVRILFYLTPILWTIEKLPEPIQFFMKANPFYYLVEGYRAALLGTNWYLVDHSFYTFYFWILVFGLLIVGSVLHVKFRNRFMDFL
jgi:teichoic acid transport system permease protein